MDMHGTSQKHNTVLNFKRKSHEANFFPFFFFSVLGIEPTSLDLFILTQQNYADSQRWHKYREIQAGSTSSHL